MCLDKKMYPPYITRSILIKREKLVAKISMLKRRKLMRQQNFIIVFYMLRDIVAEEKALELLKFAINIRIH